MKMEAAKQEEKWKKKWGGRVFHMKSVIEILWCLVTSSTSVRKQFVIIPKVLPNLKDSEADAMLER